MQSAVTRTKAKSEINLEWMHKNEESISKWLFDNIEVEESGAAAFTFNLALVVAVTLISVFLRH